MTSIGASELVLILLIAFIVVGPKDLPKVARALGRFVKKAKAMLQEIKKETGLDELTDELNDIQKDIKTSEDGTDLGKQLTQPIEEINKSLGGLNKEINQAKKEFNFKDLSNHKGGK